MNSERNCIGGMSRVKELTKCAIDMRELIGCTKDEIFWMQIELGSIFLNTHFGIEAKKISDETNFWDLYLFEWYKDDEFLLKHINLDDMVGNVYGYRLWKDYLRCSDMVLNNVYEFLEKK